MAKKAERIPVSGADLQEALSAVETLLTGDGTVKTNPDNLILMGVLKGLENGALKGYLRGRSYTEQEVRDLPVGSVIWIFWAKDNHPDRVRFDGAYRVTAKKSDAFAAHDGHDWTFDGDTGRGQARYFAANKASRETIRTVQILAAAREAELAGNTQLRKQLIAKLSPRKQRARGSLRSVPKGE